MPKKNPNPKVISSSDARIEGQIQIEDVVVLEQSSGGDPVILNASGPALSINGNEAPVLDDDGLLPINTLPQVALVSVTVVADEEEQLALDADQGDVAVREDIEAAFMHNGGDSGTLADWSQLSFLYVTSVAGKTGVVTLELADIEDWDAADYAAAVHAHAISDVTDLQTALDGKAASSHSHSISDVTGLQTALDGKVGPSHTQPISDITGLQTALDGKAASTHSHAISDVTGLQTSLNGKASTGDITTLQTAIDGKAATSHTHTASAITDLNARQTLTQTVTVAAGAEVSVTLPLAKAFGLWKLTTDKAARVRIYSTDADRTADTSRAEGAAPAAGTGLVTEVITSASLLSVPLTPPQFGSSLESTPSSNISALVKNKAATADVTITLTWTPFG